MQEILLILLAWAVVLGFLSCAVALPIWALLRTRQITKLRARLDRLEKRLQETELLGKAEAPAQPPEQPAGEFLREPSAPTEVAVEAELVESARAGEAVAATLENWIGRRGLGWVAVVLLLLATAFFLKHAFENRWIGELGRVALGIAAGVALCAAGFHYHRRGWTLLSQMATAGGAVLLYLATYAAFGFYHLLPQQPAAVFLIVLIAETAGLAVLYEAPAIALMAVVGALSTPVLLQSDRDLYRSLFMYLVVVNAGVVGMMLMRCWRLIGTVALLGTQGLFWLWYAANYHPEKLVAAISFQVAIFILFVAYSLAAHVLRRTKANVEDLVRLVLNAFVFFVAAYVLLDEDYHVWMGTLALGMALVYTGLGWAVLLRRPEDQRQLLVVVATAMGFVAMVFPLQADAAWVGLGWAVQGLALWWFGHRVRADALRAMGAALLALAVGRLVFIDTPDAHRLPFVPLLNSYAVPAVAVAACVLTAAATAWSFPRRLTPLDRLASGVIGLAGVGLLWLILSVETHGYFAVQMDQYGVDRLHLSRMAQVALSVAWAVYAAIVMAVGFYFRSTALRWTALVLFAATLGKVVLVDMAGLSGYYRVAAFMALAVMMAGAARAYQKRQLLSPADDQEVLKHV